MDAVELICNFAQLFGAHQFLQLRELGTQAPFLAVGGRGDLFFQGCGPGSDQSNHNESEGWAEAGLKKPVWVPFCGGFLRFKMIR